ncbi:MAG TPA: hypothetical protein VMG12_25260 [Polyangiaceae bacterium]|nr:hypothetical protein [Polyangiaceae bacterium]
MGCPPRTTFVARLGVCFALALSSSLACQRSSQSRLEGRWLGHRFESLDGSIGAGRAGWAKGASLTFEGSRVSVRVPGEPARSGDYRVLSDRDGELELAIVGHDGHVDRAELTLETDELMRWHLTPVHTLVMHHD